MVKQRFIETYGVPDWTVGFGGSGGSLQLLQIAQDYPGLLDGIIANRTLPDAPTLVPLELDCSVLVHYFSAPQVPWTPDQRAAVEGFLNPRTCDQTFSNLTGIGLPRVCPPAVPASAVYDAASHPDGVRCDVFDSVVNVYGRNPVTGFANRFWGNQGVRYGLRRCWMGGSAASSSSTSTSGLAGWTSTAASSHTARRSTRRRCAPPTAPAGSAPLRCDRLRERRHSGACARGTRCPPGSGDRLAR
jgi:Tannase-like family of unknown function (DUF6351)